MKKYLLPTIITSIITLSAQAETKELHYILCGNEPTIGLEEYIADFEKMHKNVKIKLEMVSWNQCQDKATNLAIAGNPPAMAYMGARVLKQLYNGDLTIEVPMTQEEKDSYYPSMIKAVTSEGKILGIPVASSTRALYYNKDLFQQAGLDPETPPTTWDELYETSKIIVEKTDASGFGIAGKAHDSTFLEYLSWAAGNGVDMVDDQGQIQFDTKENRKALQMFAKMQEVSVANPTSWLRADFTNLFNQNKVAMFVNGPWVRNSINEDINWGIAPVPHGPDGDYSSILIVDSMAIFKNSGMEDIATKFAKYITNPEHQFRYESEYGLTPVRPVEGVKELVKNDPTWQPFITAVENAVPEPLLEDYRAMQDIVIDTIQAVLLGDESVEDALKYAQQDLEDL